MLEIVGWIWIIWIGGSWTQAGSQLLQALYEMRLLYLSLLWPLSLPLVSEEEFLICIVVLLHLKWWKHLFVHKIGSKEHHHHYLQMKMMYFWSLKELKKVTRFVFLKVVYVNI